MDHKQLEAYGSQHRVYCLSQRDWAEIGLKGARDFAQAITPAQRAKTLRMVSIDSITTGDQLRGYLNEVRLREITVI